MVAPHTEVAQVWITQIYLQIAPNLPLRSRRSPDGATIDCNLVLIYWLQNDDN